MCAASFSFSLQTVSSTSLSGRRSSVTLTVKGFVYMNRIVDCDRDVEMADIAAVKPLLNTHRFAVGMSRVSQHA